MQKEVSLLFPCDNNGTEVHQMASLPHYDHPNALQISPPPSRKRPLLEEAPMSTSNSKIQILSNESSLAENYEEVETIGTLI